MSRKKILFIIVLLLVASLVAGGVRAAGLTRVTGSGNVVVDGVIRTATIAALRLPNGTVIGEGQGVLHTNPVLVVHYKIDCMKIIEEPGYEGKGAILSGPLTHVVNPPPGLPENLDLLIKVIDDGEGPDAEDFFSRAVAVPRGLINCYSDFPLPPATVQNGNVQVND